MKRVGPMKWIKAKAITVIMSILSTLVASFVVYVFSFHNDLIAMKIEFAEKRDVLKSIDNRLDSLDTKIENIYSELLKINRRSR